jgi:hypothetical protein
VLAIPTASRDATLRTLDDLARIAPGLAP